MKNTENLTHKRHTLAHLLGASVKELYPQVKLAIGPAVDNGFYYDFDFSDGPAPKHEDLGYIEDKMNEILESWNTVTCKELDYQKDLANGSDSLDNYFPKNRYKQEILSELYRQRAKITFYTMGTFEDLCKGGHVDNPAKEINKKSFKLSHIAGAYWRGDEKNKMLTRIYGLAFDTKEELDAYIFQQEEAKKRDHRKIGKEMGLFVFSELIGGGLPLWTPKGTVIRELLNEYVWELRKVHGYEKVTIPHITKKELYETSGHWAKYADDLFKIHTREDHLYAMKPMNCPHHTQIFDAEPKSYRDMPKRYCETTMVYRDEQSGELSGLSRVLSITQDDAHVFCRENQIETETLAVWDIIETFYKTFGFDLEVRFSRHDPETPEKYLGGKEVWEKSENALKKLMEHKGVQWIDGIGEAAFYGPKIDFIAHDSIGRVLQVATIQLDFNQPKNFGLMCTNEKGEKEQVVMIHCAVMGSIERFMSTLIEHLAGNFPLWLSPTQVAIVPVRETHTPYADEIFKTLKAKDIRVTLLDGDDSLGKRIRKAKTDKVPYVIVIGDKEKESGVLTIETREGEKLEYTLEEFMKNCEDNIESKKL